jgi:hypothetical protein
MANKKITELADLGSSVKDTDILHIIDGAGTSTPVNKNISVGDLFGNVPSLLNLSQTPEIITSSTAIDISKVVTLISTGSSELALTLADGNKGQLKFLIMTAGAGADAVITPTNLFGGSTIRFTDVGDSVILLFTGNTTGGSLATDWAVVSNNGVIIT